MWLMTPRRTVVLTFAFMMTWAMVLEVRPSQAQSYGPNGQVQSRFGDWNLTASRPRMRPEQESGGTGTNRELSTNEVEAGQREESEGESEEEADEIETDRDSFTPATSTVGRGRTIFESAYSFIDNRSVAETHSFPEILARYGLTDRIELRIGWNYEIGGAGNPISGNLSELAAPPAELEEEAKLLYGTKLFLTEQNGWTPQSAFIFQGATPTFGESNLTTLNATHVFGWKLENGWTWDTATRFGTSGTPETHASPRDHFNVWSPSTVIKVPLSERAKAHAEYFGVFSAGREEETTQQFISPGVNFLINPNLEVGARVAWGLNDQSPEFFSNVGFGWRF
jgi:hypothetical protein